MATHNHCRSRPIQKFWRNADLPFIELRDVSDGREVCYAPHVHETFSLGAITGGTSTYVNGKHVEQVGTGSVVVINPGDVHACNPVRNQPWSYRMLYVEANWLARLQGELGSRGSGFQAYATAATTDAVLHRGAGRLCEILMDDETSHLEMECAALAFFTDMQTRLEPRTAAPHIARPRLESVAEYIKLHCTQPIRVQDLCDVSGLSPSHLIRAFKERYGMTPHVYQMNSRIEYCRGQLKHGRPIADIAADAGFSDQAHMQRTFKRFVAATPGQYLNR
jgi:AraC-like DNA-binding protein